MNQLCPVRRIALLLVLLAAIALSSHPAEASGHRTRLSYPQKRSRGPPAQLDSDSELLRALEFLENYERAKSREESDGLALTDLDGDLQESIPYEPYPMQNANGIPPLLTVGNGIPYGPMKWDEAEEEEEEGDEEDDELAMEDLFPPQPVDLETNEVAFAEAMLDEYRDYEGRRQRELFEKILGDVMAEKRLQEDERENIKELLEEQQEEERGMEDLAAILDTSSSVSSSAAEGEIGLYDPEEIQLSMFSASSEPGAEVIVQESESSVAEGVPDVDEDSFFLSEAGLEALEEAEQILKGGYEGSEASENIESAPDFDDVSDLPSFIQDPGDFKSSEADESEGDEEEVKEEALKDVIYRIVEEHLRRKLVQSMGEEEYLGSSVADTGSFNAEDKTESVDEDALLDNLVGEIREQVDKLSSRIMQQIESGKVDADDTSESDSREITIDAEIIDTSSSDGYFNEQPIMGAESSSIADDALGDELSSVAGDEYDASSASSMGEEEEPMSDEALLNAIRDIVPVPQTKVCPVLSYLVDDCSVIDGFKGLGSGGYREAFSRPCNRHQICYTCSNSYGIPTDLCDEIMKAELLTLCNGDPECKQRAKYFWFAATNDRTAPNVSLSLCRDRCVLDYLLRD